jgi:hypothetical protein
VSGLTNPITNGIIADNRRLDAGGAMREILTPNASVRAAKPSGREGKAGLTPVQMTVRLSLPVVFDPVEVTYTTVDDTAVAGEDYVAASGTLVFERGEQEKTITVQVSGDTLLEPDEAFRLTITDITNGRLGEQQSAEYRIINDEAPVVTIAPAVVFEETGRRVSAVFEVTYAGAATAPVMLSYTTRNGTAIAREDYVSTQGTLVFLRGETKKQIAVPIIGDTRPEQDEIFYLVVAGSRNSTVSEESQSIAGYIVDDDSRTVSVTAQSPGVVGGQPAAFRVTLTRSSQYGVVFPSLPDGVAAPNRSISATVGTVSQSLWRGVPSAVAGSDYVTTSRTLAFTPTTLEHILTVPTAAVDRRKAFVMRVAGTQGVRVGEESAGVQILSAAGEMNSVTTAARGRRGGFPITAWGGLSRISR